MSAVVYRIRDWLKHFENNRTKDIKNMGWVPIPNKHDGDGFTELMDHANGVAHYGAWIIMVQIASKCDPRGTLLRESAKPSTSHLRAHTPQSLARMAHAPAAFFEEAIPRLLDIGWLEIVDPDSQQLIKTPQEGAAPPQEAAPSRARAGTERNRTNENGTEPNRSERSGTEREHRTPAPPVPAAAPPDRSSDRPDRSSDRSLFQSAESEKPAPTAEERLEAAAKTLAKAVRPEGFDPIQQQTELEELCLEVLGKDEMARCGSRWRDRAKDNPGKLKRVLVDLRQRRRECGRTKEDVKNPGRYAEDLWKRFV